MLTIEIIIFIGIIDLIQQIIKFGKYHDDGH